MDSGFSIGHSRRYGVQPRVGDSLLTLSSRRACIILQASSSGHADFMSPHFMGP